MISKAPSIIQIPHLKNNRSIILVTFFGGGDQTDPTFESLNFARFGVRVRRFILLLEEILQTGKNYFGINQNKLREPKHAQGRFILHVLLEEILQTGKTTLESTKTSSGSMCKETKTENMFKEWTIQCNIFIGSLKKIVFVLIVFFFQISAVV